MKSALQVLFEDHHLLIVVKPPGVPTQGDASGDPCLLDLAQAYLRTRSTRSGDPFVGMVHRLDRPTGGVVAIGRSEKATSRLKDLFRQRRVSKTYLAACHGLPKRDRGKLVHFLKKLPGVNRMMVLEKEKHGSQRAELSYQLLGKSDNGRDTLVEVQPLTGRQHQIRAQLAHAGHPIIFDVKYGKETSDRSIVPVIGLWAYRLQLAHPNSGKTMIFTAHPEASPGSAWEPFAELLRTLEQSKSTPRFSSGPSHMKSRRKRFDTRDELPAPRRSKKGSKKRRK